MQCNVSETEKACVSETELSHPRDSLVDYSGSVLIFTSVFACVSNPFRQNCELSWLFFCGWIQESEAK